MIADDSTDFLLYRVLSDDDINRLVSLIVSIIKRKGSRNDICIWLSGLLFKHNLVYHCGQRMIESLFNLAGDEEKLTRLKVLA